MRGVSIQVETWHEATIWAQGSRIAVLVDGKRAAVVTDRFVRDMGALPAGDILFQPNDASFPIQLDDIMIQAAEPASSFFEENEPPQEWADGSTEPLTLGRDGDFRFLQIRGDTVVEPTMRPLANLRVDCTLRVEQGGYRLVLRKGEAGAVVLEFAQGSLTIRNMDGAGNEIENFATRNVYNLDLFESWSVSLVGDVVRVVRNGGEKVVEETLTTAPESGGIAFETGRRDIVDLVSCLFTEIP